ncbi:MAG: type III restriction endonuclease, partial [Bacteroidota bacterium]|nr:type III restriction endonuclease [Bacteroidota bacterium]
KISAQNLIDELNEGFSEEKCISVNSQNDSEEKQLIINTLEDKDNEFRVVFAVDKLNEGWDVLNLYDIVRLYDTRDSKSGKPGKSTVSEAQLIGRGARYCPFQTNENQEKYQRKFDKDAENELKIAEELHYHASYNPRYIQELNTALKETGIIADDTIEKKLKLKESFKQTDIYEKGIIFLNKRIKNTSATKEFRSPEILKQHKYTFHTGLVKETTVFGNDLQIQQDTEVQQYTLKKFNRSLLKKAMNQFDKLQFSEIKKWFPLVKSIDDFIENEKYLGEVKITVKGVFYKAEFAAQKQKYELAKYVLSEILKGFKTTAEPHIGTKRFEAHLIKQVFKEKTLRFQISKGGESEVGKSILRSDIPNDLSTRIDTRDWHSYTDNFGTSEEKYLVKFIDSQMNELQEKYSEIHLLRNERFFQLYNFEDGKALEPDYLLYLQEKDTKNRLFYQLFIEPKGEQLIEKDKWKQDFLQSIEKEAQLVWNLKNRTYKVIGLPFYNEKIQKSLFGDKLKEALNY